MTAFKLVRLAGLCIVFAFTLEFILTYSDKSAYQNYEEKQLDLGKFYSSSMENIQFSTDGINIHNFEEVSMIYDGDLPLKSISINLTCKSVIKGQVLLKDEGMKQYWQHGTQFHLLPGGGTSYTTTFSLKSQGNAKAILIQFYNNEEDFCIHSITANHYETHFQIYRAAALSVCFWIMALGWHYRDKKWGYQKKNRKTIFFVIGAILVAGSIFIWTICAVHGIENLEYKTDNLGKNIYLYMFDSWQKGITYLDIIPDEKLLALENVYDRSERDMAGCTYMWDYAFYHGKYYSYYGVSPLILIYIPYYLITGMLPNDNMAGLLCNIFNMILLCCVLYTVLELFKVECSLILLILESFAVAAGSMMYSLQACANQLYILNLCTCFCTLLFLLASMRAYLNRTAVRYVWMITAGTAAVLLVESRPSAAIAAGMFVLPLYTAFLCSNQVTKRQKLLGLISFFAVVGIGAGCVCWYNYDRFGNILDFGKNYQLTAYDANHYDVTIDRKKIINTVYYYLLEAPKFLKTFPFVELNNDPVDGMGHYYLKDPNLGILFIPMIFGLFFIKFIKKRKHNENKMVPFGIAGALICMYLNFNLGGVQLRYHTDYLLILLLIAFLAIAQADTYLAAIENGYVFRRIFLLLCLFTIFLGMMLIFSNQLHRILERNPMVYTELFKLFSVY